VGCGLLNAGGDVLFAHLDGRRRQASALLALQLARVSYDRVREAL
jgi:hypothetical protein